MKEKDVIYRCIGDDFDEGVIACGYMPKPLAEQSQYHFVTGYYSAFVVLSGTGTYQMEDGSIFYMEQGDFVQRFPETVHTTQIDGDGEWNEFFVSFGKTIYKYMRRLGILPEEPVCKNCSGFKEIGLFDQFLKKLKEARNDDLPELLPEIQKVLLKMCKKEQPIFDLKLELGDNHSYDHTLELACVKLEADFDGELDLVKLANSLHMGYESFRKLFRAYKGVSPAKYRCEKRIQHAKLLLSSGLSIKETAQMVGYADTYSFTKQFTKKEGVSPGRYIKERRAKYTEIISN